MKRAFHSRRAHPTVADSLPPPWRPGPSLALENRYVRGELPNLAPFSPALRMNVDPRALQVGVNADSGTVITRTQLGDVELGTGAEWPMSRYGGMLMHRSFRRLWTQRSNSSINSLGVNTPATGASQGGFQIPLPRLPGRIGSILGPGGPAINVRGSENIRISGTSNWTNQQVGQLGQKRSLFPSLDMQQDLDIALEGQLSDRIRVNLLQNSANQIPLANRIAINYRGDEDALFQAVDLGNTNLTLPGTQYVSYSGKNEGLFGMKATSRFGPLDFTMLASKQEGRSERASYGGGSSKQNATIRDYEYVRGTYFFFEDPSLGGQELVEASLRVYVDDGIVTNDVANTVVGIAVPDPTNTAYVNAARGVTDSATVASSFGNGQLAVRGTFTLLTRGADKDYEILPDVYGSAFKVLRLTQPLTGQQRLAVTYRRSPYITATELGSEQSVGGQPDPTTGVPATIDDHGTPRTLMKLLRVPPDYIGSLGSLQTAVFDSTKALYPVQENELRNFYNLGGQRIDVATFKMTIRKGNDQPPKTNAFTDVGSVPYLEILGLDNLNEATKPPTRDEHDGLIDGTVLTSNLRAFVDFDNGTLFFPDLRPFAPRIGQRARRFDQFVSDTLFRRATLTGGQGSDLEPNLAPYDRYVLQGDIDARYYMDVEFTAATASGEVSLGRGNLLEGSEVVTVNGRSLIRDTDYRIDYDLGRLTLIKRLGPGENLNVDYSYAPLFQQAGRTLVGSAFTIQGREKSFGGAFMYESRGAQDLRPRIGEEPARSLIADLNTDWTFHPQWLTRAVDLLPGVRTTAPSDFHVQAEVGASFPNPNTRNQVYIDDMEGARDAVSLALDLGHWRYSAVPRRALQIRPSDEEPGLVAVSSETMVEQQQHGAGVHMAELHWYSPYAVVKEGDLKPTLTDAQGRQNTRQVLAWSVPRRPLTAVNSDAAPDRLWAGLTYVLEPNGMNLQRSQFIELWVNDFNDFHDPGGQVPRIRGQHAKLHIDLGRVSEDQMRSPDQAPNGFVDTEDQGGANRDGQLDVSEGRNEDTGYDGLLDDPAEKALPRTIPDPGNPDVKYLRDLSTSTGEDPEGDDYEPTKGDFDQFKEEIDARRYRHANGTEGDHTLIPYPETEDFNLNGLLDTAEGYYEYTVDLGDDAQRYLVTDLQQLRQNPPPGETGYANVALDNGWRRYRIPIDDSLRVAFGAVDLTAARHVRVWLEGITLPDTITRIANKEVERPLLMLGGLDIVGSRWRSADIDTVMRQAGGTMTLNTVNSVDNADVYTAPFDPGETRNGNQALTRREQSLALEFTRLPAQHSVQAFKTFSLDEDYSRYGKLNWYVSGFDVHDSLDAPRNNGLLYYFVRFASDEQGLNYYEFRSPLPVSNVDHKVAWQEVQLALTELSGLKLVRADSTASRPYAAARSPGSRDTLIILGRPSFTRLRRVSFGLVNLEQQGYYRDGQLWFDELRAIDVAKDRGTAERVSVGGRLANLFTYNASWNSQDENFVSVGQTRGSGTSMSNFGVSTSLDLHRFFEATGIILPMTFNFTQGKQRPRYSAGDDIVRDGEDLRRSQSFADNRSWSISYSRTWSDRANRFLYYTVGGITANYNSSNTHSLTPSGSDRSTSSSGAVNYNIAPRQLLAIPMPFVKAKLFPLPERFYTTYHFDSREGSSADRLLGTDILVPRADVRGSSGALNMGADTRPFDFLHHHVEAARNLNLRSPAFEGKSGLLGRLNFGRVVNWSQSVDANWAPKFIAWLRPQLGWSARFAQNNGPELSPDLSVREIQNGQNGTFRWEFPFATLAGGRGMYTAPPPPPPMPGDTTRAAAPPPKPRGPALWRQALSRLGTVQAELGLTRSSRYSRVRGMPDFMYLFGMRSDPGIGTFEGARVSPVTGNQSTTARGWRTNARTTLQLPFGTSLQTSGSFASSFSTTNGAERGQEDLTFPDVSVDFGRIASVLLIDKVIKTPQIRSGLNRKVTNDYSNGRARKTSVITMLQYRPLLAISGDLPNGMRLELTTNHQHSDRLLLEVGNSLQQDINTDFSMNLTRSYSQGQKISFLGKESTVRSSITIGLNSQYERRTGRIIQNGVERNPARSDRLSVNGTGSYGFSSNVSGNATLGFSQDRDQLVDRIHRSIRVELSARLGL